MRHPVHPPHRLEQRLSVARMRYVLGSAISPNEQVNANPSTEHVAHGMQGES
jgi:hypothetical protein